MAGITLYRAEQFRAKVTERFPTAKAYDAEEALDFGLIKDYVGIKAVDVDKREASFVISDDQPDRDHDVIAINGWDLKMYKKNPVVLWAHDGFSPPIGQATAIRRDGSQLVSTVRFSEENPMGDLVWRMVQAKELRASSVGFRPTKFNFVGETDDEERRGGIDFLKQELLEWSVVPVPANPRAIVQLHGIGVDTAPLREWVERTLDMEKHLKGVAVNDLEEAWKHLSDGGAIVDMKVDTTADDKLTDVELEEKATEPDPGWSDEQIEKLYAAVTLVGGIDKAMERLTAKPKAEVRVEIKEVAKDPTVLEALQVTRAFYEQCGDETVTAAIDSDLTKFRAAGVAPKLAEPAADPTYDDLLDGDDDARVEVDDETAAAILGADDARTIEVDDEIFQMITGAKGDAPSAGDPS